MSSTTEVRLDDEAYWLAEEERSGDRTTWTISKNGWVIAECYHGSAGWRRSRKPSERILDDVLSLLPQGARAALNVGATRP